MGCSWARSKIGEAAAMSNAAALRVFNEVARPGMVISELRTN
jgi:hypothetical protein